MPKQGSAAAATDASAAGPEALFVKLSDALEDADYKKCLKLSDTILASAKGDKDALKTKLYSHIMLGRNDDALQLIQTHKSIAADVVFEKAYCLFRTGRLDAALELLQGSEGEGSQHLTAIIHMRQKHSQAASALYSSLAPKVKGNKQGSIELATNMIATLVMSGEQFRIPKTLQQFSVAAKDSFEVALNMACAAVLDGQLQEAQRLLQLAETKGLEVLTEEDVSQVEMDRELAPVRAQAAHVNFLQGNKTAAAASYSTLLLQNLQSDVALHAVCTNNSLCTQQNMDSLPKDSRKKLDTFIASADVTVSETAERRLGASACSALLRNYILSCLPSSSSGTPKSSSDGSTTSAGLRKAAQAVAEAAPDSEAAMLLLAAAASLLGSSPDGVAVIKAWVDGHSSSDVTTALLLGAHLASSGSAPKLSLSLELLSHERLPGNVRHACAVVATRAAMHEKISGDEALERLLQEAEAAAKFWQEQPASEEQASSLAACVEHQVVLCLKKGTPEVALQRLQDLQSSGAVSSSPAVRARLLRCLAALDVSAVPQAAADVEASANVSGVNTKDAEELEVSHIVSKGTSVLFGPLVRQNEGEGAKTGKVAKKRKRKPRYPKGFDPENPGPPPDPERWLPKHERAEFRKRRKRSQRNQPVSKGAQGMGVVDSSLDKSHITMEELDARAQPAAGPRLPPRSAPKGLQGKRKGRR